MYQVFKNGRSSIRRTFVSYEQARQAARKLARTTREWTDIHSLFDGNPVLNWFGYSIKKIG